MILSIIGNCQARPLSQLFEQVDAIKKVNTFVTHLSNEDSFKEDKKVLDQSDLIIAQKTSYFSNEMITQFKHNLYL